MNVSDDLRTFLADRKFGTILVDPPWQFQNRTGKIAPEHKRLSRYATLTIDEIKALPRQRGCGGSCSPLFMGP